MLATSCETTELDLTQDPNGLTEADRDFFLNAIQEDFARYVHAQGFNAGEVARIHYMFGRNYQNAYTPQGFDAEWQDAYQQMMLDIREMNALDPDGEFPHHTAIGQVIEAYLITSLVDMFGDIPYSEAFQGSDNFNPNTDPGASIYDAALALLDQAIANFEAEALGEPSNDLFYQGDYDQWIKLANSLKMKIHLQERLVDGGAVSAFENIAANEPILEGYEDDFEVDFGTNDANPDVRHPLYVANYTPSGAADYVSTWLVGTMMNDVNDPDDDDPRIRYYFYRQTDEVPVDESLLQCSVETAPAHYQAGNEFYCSLPFGYWTRDHGDDDGIPPDTQLRTAYGLYPAGGRFDDDSFGIVDRGTGAGGAGVVPILLASTIDFMQAEVALLNGDVPGAAAFMESGITKSMEKVVEQFGDKVDTDDAFAPSAGDIDDYVTVIGDIFTTAPSDDDRWNILGEQFFISLYGQGLDGYNFYRRTGYPTTVQPNIEPDPGAFIRSFLYPANFVLRNGSVDQKASVTEQVFWDNNPASPGFPPAN